MLVLTIVPDYGAVGILGNFTRRSYYKVPVPSDLQRLGWTFVIQYFTNFYTIRLWPTVVDEKNGCEPWIVINFKKNLIARIPML